MPDLHLNLDPLERQLLIVLLLRPDRPDLPEKPTGLNRTQARETEALLDALEDEELAAKLEGAGREHVAPQAQAGAANAWLFDPARKGEARPFPFERARLEKLDAILRKLDDRSMVAAGDARVLRAWNRVFAKVRTALERAD